MITGHTFGENARITKSNMNFCVRARSVNGRDLQFGTFPDRIQASVAAALVNKMKEKGETVEAIKQRVYTKHGNKGKILRIQFSEHLKDSFVRRMIGRARLRVPS